MHVPMPRLYLGTMTFGWSQASSTVDESVALAMLKLFVNHNEAMGVSEHYVDTARIYSGGKTEPIVGSLLESYTPSKGVILVGTKAHPSVEGGLSAQGIKGQLGTSMESMPNVKTFGEYYLHQPDTEHSLLESLEYTNKLVQDGIISKVGMSNYHASEMERAFQLCDENKLVRPTVYQGLYNPLNRAIEEELLPLLKRNKCSFVAFNPLAAGLLTGKHTNQNEAQKGRFKDNPNYLPRFYTDRNFEAIEIIRKACDEEGISMVEATYRWLLKHSALDENDGVLLGASSMEQLQQNLSGCMAAVEKGPLPKTILTAFDQAWEITKDGAFPYWRSYSSDMPNQESLDQGASYAAAKTKKASTIGKS